MCAPLARSDYYGTSAPPETFGRRRAYPTIADGYHTVGTVPGGSRVHERSIDRLGIQLCSGSIVTPTPQAFTVTSPPARLAGYEVDHQIDGRALHPGPYPPDLSRCLAYGALPLVPLVYRPIPLAGPDPSGSTEPSRLCQRCFPPSPASPGSDCAQLLPGCCDNPARRSSTSFDLPRLTAHERLAAQFRHTARVPRHVVAGTCTRPPVSWHALVPFAFRLQVSHQTQQTSLRVCPACGGDVTKRLVAHWFCFTVRR
jgi:hypothetical protein